LKLEFGAFDSKIDFDMFDCSEVELILTWS